MKCLLCMREMNLGSLSDILFQEDLICSQCRKKWEKKDIVFKMEGIRVRSDYVYNDAFSSCLIQFKECCDEALKDVFLYKVKKKLKHRYRGYALCMMPSSTRKTEERGFSHLKEMYACVGLPILEPFEKTGDADQKQAGRMQRMEMQKEIRLKEGVVLPKKIVLCDDTITTGSTLKGALSCIDLSEHKVEIYCVSANYRWLEEKGSHKRKHRCMNR